MLESIPRLLKPFKIKVVFKYNDCIKNILIKNSPKTNVGVIYKIPCLMCDRFYIGQTGKGLEVRIRQHQYSVRTENNSNAMFLHMSHNNHKIDWGGAVSIVENSSVVERNIIESAIIKYTLNDNMNISQGMYNLDCFIINDLVSFYAKERF